MSFKEGEVWFVPFPVEDNEGNFTGKHIARPAIVLHADNETLECLSVKLTKHSPRANDPYDTPILYWQHAKLRFESTARVAKTTYIAMDAFIFKLGELHQDDLLTIQTLYMQYILERESEQENVS